MGWFRDRNQKLYKSLNHSWTARSFGRPQNLFGRPEMLSVQNGFYIKVSVDRNQRSVDRKSQKTSRLYPLGEKPINIGFDVLGHQLSHKLAQTLQSFRESSQTSIDQKIELKLANLYI